jgi:putative ABC transport system permease protein
MLLKTLISLETQQTGFDMRHVLAINVPVMSYGKSHDQVIEFYKEAVRQLRETPQVEQVAVGTTIPWRDGGKFGPGFEFAKERVPEPGEENPRAQMRTVSSGFFAALGVPVISGRDFTDADDRGNDRVVIVSQTLARRAFPNEDAVGHHVLWVDPVMKFIGLKPEPLRIIGVAADIDDEHVVPSPMMTIYHPLGQGIGGGRLFIHARGNPYALVTPLTQIVRKLSADQVVERAATLEDVRAEVLTPDRLNALVFGVFAAVALAIAIVGVAGVLAFSVSGRTREFGIRMAIGSQAWRVLMGVVAEGAVMAGIGVGAGVALGYTLAQFAGSYLTDVRMPGAALVVGAAATLFAAAMIASALPALRAARVDVMQALRSD